jgi:hypothetical protein
MFLLVNYSIIQCFTNNTLFISICIWGIFPSRRTLGHYAEGAHPILYVPMFPWKYFLFTKWERSEEIKRVVYERGGSSPSAFSWGLGTPSGSCPWVPLPQKNTLIRDPPPSPTWTFWNNIHVTQCGFETF